jgi:hypothetical protein
MGKPRQREILLKTDQRTSILELIPNGKFAS